MIPNSCPWPVNELLLMRKRFRPRSRRDLPADKESHKTVEYLEVPVTTEDSNGSARIRRVRSISPSITDSDAPLIQRGDTPLDNEHQPCRLWGKFVVADEENIGPLFNYARVHSWQRIASFIIDAHACYRRDDLDCDIPANFDALALCDLDKASMESQTRSLHWTYT